MTNKDELIKKGCYNYLGAYASYIEPEFERPKHIKYIIENLAKLERGDITKLIITMPPRMGKSLLTSKIFPTWFLGRHPNKNVIFTTYGQEFAEDFGRYVRNTIQRPEFLNVFPNATLSTDSTSIKRFALEQGGNYFAVGAGGSITGRGADCLVGETIVYTENGEMRLDLLHQLQYNGKILSFNHELNKYEYRYIQASRCISQKQVITIQTCRGNSIRATAEHKIYIKGKGYIEAKFVRRGDEIIFQSKNNLQLLWQRIFNNKIRINKKNKKRIQKTLLFKQLSKIVRIYKNFQTMFSLWKEKINKKKEILFRSMQTSYNAIFQKEIKKDLCWMSETIYAQGTSTDILQSKMFLQECRTARKWNVQSNKISSNIFKKIKTFNKRTRPKFLCFMQETKRSLCTSYRRKCYEQFIRKFNNFMSSMSYIRASWNRTTITDVIFDCNEQHNVYDIQVEGNNNFFANGILVHNCAIIDDPFRNRQEANSINVRRRVIDWFKSTLFTRLSPTGRIIIIQCMVGDTKVLMANNTEKELKDIRVGDEIATYKNGEISTSKVVNWANQGKDHVFTIKMKSGIIVRANERHPFLVNDNNELKWKKLKNLKKGTAILRVIGKEKNALLKNVKKMQDLKDSACPIITNIYGHQDTDHLHAIQYLEKMQKSNIDMESHSMNMNPWLKNKMEDVQYVKNCQEKMSEPTGEVNFASTTVTIQKKLEDCSVMIATLPSDMEKPQKFLEMPLNTYQIIPDYIEEIEYYGIEDVFDIQVQNTENFIANGLVSHNTRWHESDLAGYILENEPEGWTHLNLPAISDDGEALWPEVWPVEKLEKIKSAIGSYEWAALYQQRPAPQDGGMFAKTWFEIIDAIPRGNITSTVRYWDRAATIEASGKDPDYTVGVKMSKDRNGTYYIEDVVRLRNTSLEVQKAIMNTASRDGYNVKIVLEQDPGQAGKSEVEYLIRLLSGFNVRANRVSKDKVTRATPFSAQCEAGNIKLLKASWNEAFLEELSMFPFGSHDDQVDAAGQGFMELTSPTLNYHALTRM